MLELIGRYRIQEQIGEGAMADVYRAYDPHIDRALAVKVLKAQYRQDREYAHRFLREARAAGALSHPGIVTIFDVGEVDGYPFIVMELLEGQPLSEVLRGGAMPVVSVMSVGIQLAEALAYAHSQGVVHRDVKPSNIVISPDGKTIKLLDFGIARIADSGPLFEKESLHTQVGQVIGTPRYMSPEQAIGHDLDGRSDLYSVGVILYELVSGRRAFAGATAGALTAQIIASEPEPLATLAPDTPRGLQFIIGKAMMKQRSARFADGYRLADALRRELAVNHVVQREAAHGRYLPLPVRLTLMMAAITTLVLALAVGTVLVRQRSAMERVALAAGSAVSSFVANNAALRAVDNATLPPALQDWVPTQVFVRSASDDPNIRSITVVGADGIVRAATNQAIVGQPYRAATGERVVGQRNGATVSETANTNSLRFVRPIVYARRTVGKVDVAVSEAELQSAWRLSTIALILLALVTLGTVAAVTYLSARLLQAPIRRLRGGLLEITNGNLDIRLSHNRRDEFGELFDDVNLVAQSVQDRLNSVEALLLDRPASADETNGEAPLAEEEDLPIIAAADPAVTPAVTTPPAPPGGEAAPDRPRPPVTEDQAKRPHDAPAATDLLRSARVALAELPDEQQAARPAAPPDATPAPVPEDGTMIRPATPWPQDEDEDRTLVGGPDPYR